MEEDWEDWDDEEDEEEECLSQFAYQGFGPVCLSLGCRHWGGDGLCSLAIEWMVADEAGTPGPEELCPLG